MLGPYFCALNTDLPKKGSGEWVDGTFDITGSITTKQWTNVRDPAVRIDKNGIYYVKGIFYGNNGTAITDSTTAKFQVVRKSTNDSGYAVIAEGNGRHNGTMTAVQVETIIYLSVGTIVAADIWTSVADAKFNTKLYIVPLRYL